jgi:Mn-dependent DtxR family transcriptional regulator
MLEQLLNEIRNGGTLETAVLAVRLGTSPELVSIMLEHLQRLGLIQTYDDCTGGCRGCALQESCSSPRALRLWQTPTS